MKALIVKSAFGDYPRGARIDDPDVVEKIAAERPGDVLAIEVPEPPESTD